MRKKSKVRDLPWRMYRHGLSYRLWHPDGRKINLGRDLNSALLRYQMLLVEPPEGAFCTAEEVARMLKRHAKGAKERKLSFGIDAEHIMGVLAEQHHRCAVTNLLFRGDKPPGSRIRPWLPSIDRINHRVGYEPGNVRVVCGFVNIALNAFGDHGLKLFLDPLIETEVQRRMEALTANHCRCHQEEARLPPIMAGLREIRGMLD